MSRIPVPRFTDCSVADGGTLGPADIQVGGPHNGWYRVLIQAEPVTFAQPVGGGNVVPDGDPVTWTRGEQNDWPIEMAVRVIPRWDLYPGYEIAHPPGPSEYVPDALLRINPSPGANFTWNPSGPAMLFGNSHLDEMARYSYGGDIWPVGGAIDWENPDLIRMRGGLIHVPNEPDPRYVDGAPFTAFPGCVDGFGYDRYGTLREEWRQDGAFITTPVDGLIGVTDGFVGDIVYLDPDPNAPQTYIFSVWRWGVASAFNSSLRKLNPYPVEYVVNLPGAVGGDPYFPGSPRRDEMQQWTSMFHAQTNRVRSKMFNTLSVWQGDRIQDLTEIESSGNSSIDGGVTVAAVEGETYMIQVGTGDSGVNGSAVLTWKPEPV